MSAPVLPQHDPDSDARARRLVQARSHYAYSFDKYESLPMLAELPKAEQPPKAWSAVVSGALKLAVKNAGATDREDGALGSGLSRAAHEVANVFGELAHHHGIYDVVNDVSSILLAGDLSGRAQSVESYREFFQTLPLPAAAAHLQDDAAFAQKALRGANPMSIQRVQDRAPMDFAEGLRMACPGDSVESAFEEGRLFELDYAQLRSLEPNTVGGAKRYTLAPKVLLVAGSQGLRPAGIRLESGGPVFTPDGGWGWQVAKTHAAVADTIAGALYFHHARTHIVAEPMVISMHRHLAASHPLHRLLAPHFAGTLYINEVGYKTVFAEHGALDWFTGSSRSSLRQMVCESVRSFDFDRSVLHAELDSRGVLDDDVLPDYPYRDDGLLVWNAIARWVNAYLSLYYPSDTDVAADMELRSWLLEIKAADGGGLQGIGQGAGFATRAYLGSTLTQIIFAGSAQHAAMNFPVADEMTFVPNSPFGAYGTPPKDQASVTQQQWLDTLPPMGAAQRQFVVALLLGQSRYGQIADYPQDAFQDPRVVPLLSAFQSDLAQVEKRITERNLSRSPYLHLLPSRIPPGINI